MPDVREHEAGDRRSGAAEPGQARAAESRLPRVLFMDDEEAIRVMTQALLEGIGLEVVAIDDGGAAVREYAGARRAGRPYDLVILDLTMAEGMNGVEVMREMLQLDPGARGIVSSGYANHPVTANFRAHGFRASVPKPYRLSDFARTIREVLSAP